MVNKYYDKALAFFVEHNIILTEKQLDNLKSKISDNNTTFEDVKKVVDSMTKEDILKFGSGNFKDNPNTIYRDVEYINGYGGFIEVYKYKNNIPYVVIGVNQNARNKGLATKLVKKMLANVNEPVIEWRCDRKNIASSKLAEKCGFQLYNHTKNQLIYRYYNKALNESYIINQKDIYYNKDKFDSGEINLCFITGLSGSGKTTMALNMTKGKEDDVDQFALDDLLCVKDHFTMEQLKQYGDLIYSYFNGIGKRWYVTDKELDEKFHNEFHDHYEDIMMPEFVNYAKQYAKQHPEKKFVIEGVWLFNTNFKPEDFKEYAVYIKGTSALISRIRAAKRDSEDGKHPNIAFIHNISNLKRWKYYFADEKDINKWRNYFSNLIKKGN